MVDIISPSMARIDVIAPRGKARGIALAIIFEQEGIGGLIKTIRKRGLRIQTAYKQADPYDNGVDFARVPLTPQTTRQPHRRHLHLLPHPEKEQ